MKNLVLALTTVAAVALVPSIASAGEADMCKGCHNGSVGPAVDALKAKFKTVDELVAGAKNSKNPMMKAAQSDEAKLKAAATELLK